MSMVAAYVLFIGTHVFSTTKSESQVSIFLDASSGFLLAIMTPTVSAYSEY